MGITMKMGSAGQENYERFDYGRMKIGTETPLKEEEILVGDSLIEDTPVYKEEIEQSEEPEVEAPVIEEPVLTEEETSGVELRQDVKDEIEANPPKKAGRPKKTE